MMKRWNWGHSIALAYTLFALGTVGLLAFATRQSEELVSPDYYTQALGYDRIIEATRNTRELGAAFTATVSPGGDMITLTFPEDQRATVAGTVTWYRPSDSHADRSLPIAVGRDGVEQIPLQGLASGAWRLRVDWTAGQRPYHYEQLIEAR